MVRGKAASSSTSLACIGTPPVQAEQWLHSGFDSVFALLCRCAAPGCNQALWNTDLEPEATAEPPPQTGALVPAGSAPRLKVRAEAAAGLIEDGSTYCVDHGGIYHFTVNLSDAAGAIVGLPLLPQRSWAGGVLYHCDGPSDGNGDIRISADTRAAQPGQSHALVLPGINASLNVKVYEFVQVRLVTFVQLGERVRAELELLRRDGQAFADLGSWRGHVRVGEGASAPFMRGHAPDSVPVSTGWLPATCPATLQVRLGFPSNLDRLLVGSVDLAIPPPDA